MLECYVHINHSNLDLYFLAVAFAYNTWIYSTKSYLGYAIVNGKKPVNLADVKFNVTSNQIYTDPNDYLNKLEMNRSKHLETKVWTSRNLIRNNMINMLTIEKYLK